VWYGFATKVNQLKLAEGKISQLDLDEIDQSTDAKKSQNKGKGPSKLN
jgi:hypothetical protein